MWCCKKREPSDTDEVPATYTNPPRFTAVEYMKRRVDDKIQKYSKRGFRYRCLYLSMSSLALVLAASVPVLINLEGGKLWATFMSLGVTVLVGLEGVFHFREQWRNYDLLKSRLREERWLYITHSGEYAKKEEPEALQKFVEVIEDEIARERVETIGLRTVIQQKPAPTEGNGK